jgi:hypothetical protein
MTPVKRRMNLRYAPRGLANPVAGMVIAHSIVFVGDWSRSFSEYVRWTAQASQFSAWFWV